MDKYTSESDHLKHLYLTGVRPNGKDIGIGSYGRVFEVEYCGSVYAAKEVHSILVQGVTPEEFEGAKRAFLTECAQSLSLGHPNIVQFLGVYNPGGEALLPVLVMERMHDNLTSVTREHSNIPMRIKVSILLDVSRGLWYLHSHNPPIVHRDLSPNNILLTNSFVAKISDLGVTKVIEIDKKNTKTRAPGTVDFMGPEALVEIPEYGPPLDIFSFGGVILHTVNQEWPKPLHYIIIDPKSKQRIALSEVQRRQEHLDKMKSVPSNLRVLVEQCLNDDPVSRPLIADVSDRMKKMKEAEDKKFPDVNINPKTWQMTELLKELSISRVQQPVGIPNKELTVIWENKASLPVGRTSCEAVLLDGLIYIGGGYVGNSVCNHQNCHKMDIYDLSTNQWSPTPIATPYHAYAMTVLENKLITVGGLTKRSDEFTKKILALNGTQWKEYSRIPTARACATAVGHYSTLMVIGGKANLRGKWMTIPTVEVLDTTSGCWYTCNSLPMPHCLLQAAIFNNSLYLLGGFGADNKSSSQVFTASLETLSTHQLNWQFLNDTPLHSSSIVVMANKYLLTVGGRHPTDATNQSSKVYLLNKSTGLWELITNIPVATSGPAVVVVTDNKILAVGGTIGSKERLYSTNVLIGTFGWPCTI